MDDVESSNEYGAPGSYMDAYHRKLDWAASGSDVPHHVVLTVLYDVPAVPAHPLLNAALAAWRVGVLETLQSGPPFTVVTAANTTNAFSAGPTAAEPAPRSVTALGRADVDPLVRHRRVRRAGAVHLRQLTAIRPARTGPGDDGPDAGEELPPHRTGEIRPPGGGVQPVQPRNLQSPGVAFGSPDFGVMSSARPGRTLQLGLRLAF